MESGNPSRRPLTWAIVIGAASAVVAFFALFFLMILLFPPGPFGEGEILPYAVQLLVAALTGFGVAVLAYRRMSRRVAGGPQGTFPPAK